MSCKLLIFNFAEILHVLILVMSEAGLPAAGSHSTHSVHCTDMHNTHAYVHAYVKLRNELMATAQMLLRMSKDIADLNCVEWDVGAATLSAF